MKKLVYVILAMSCGPMFAQASNNSLEPDKELEGVPLRRQRPQMPMGQDLKVLEERNTAARAVASNAGPEQKLIDHIVATSIWLDERAERRAESKDEKKE
jgi:hypothetical protein